MIIFDTNAVNMMPLDGPVADIVRKLRQSRHHRVAVPWIVLEEMSAHQAAMYPVRHQAVLNTLKNLRDVVPWDLQGSVESLDLDRFLAHWRDGYSEIFEVIETSGDAARKALAREAMALPPAKRDNKRSEGARDVAVWFSILEFLEKNPDEHVCFVTANTKDFGDGTNYPHPMDADLGDLGARLTRLTNFEDVVAKFTKEVSGKDAEAAANNLLRSAPIQSRLARTAGLLGSITGFLGMSNTGAPVRWHSWLTSPEAEILSVKNVSGHEIEEDTWYTADTRWLLHGLATDGKDAQTITCVWDVQLLFSAPESGQTPTFLDSGDPTPPDMSDEQCVEAIKRLKQRVSDAARRNSSLPGHTTHGTNLAQQFADALPKYDIERMFPGANLAQQFADAMPKYDIERMFPGANLAQQFADAMPKYDIERMFPGANLAQQFADAMPKYDIERMFPGAKGTPDPSSGSESEPNEDEDSETDTRDSP